MVQVTEALNLGRELLSAVRELTEELRAARRPPAAHLTQAVTPLDRTAYRTCYGEHNAAGRCLSCHLPVENHPIVFNRGHIPIDWTGRSHD